MNRTFTERDGCKLVSSEYGISLAHCKLGCERSKQTIGVGCNVVNYSAREDSGEEYSVCVRKVCVVPIPEPRGGPRYFGMSRSDAKGYYMIGIINFIV